MPVKSDRWRYFPLTISFPTQAQVSRIPLAFCRQPGVTLHFVHLDRELVNTNFKEVSVMAKHHPDLIFCRKQPGVGILL